LSIIGQVLRANPHKEGKEAWIEELELDEMTSYSLGKLLKYTAQD